MRVVGAEGADGDGDSCRWLALLRRASSGEEELEIEPERGGSIVDARFHTAAVAQLDLDTAHLRGGDAVEPEVVVRSTLVRASDDQVLATTRFPRSADDWNPTACPALVPGEHERRAEAARAPPGDERPVLIACDHDCLADEASPRNMQRRIDVPVAGPLLLLANEAWESERGRRPGDHGHESGNREPPASHVLSAYASREDRVSDLRCPRERRAG
jgi:hypothetical protein